MGSLMRGRLQPLAASLGLAAMMAREIGRVLVWVEMGIFDWRDQCSTY